ncbi:hypothetical protein N9164_01220 [Draconibacterium sp.]|nr:hypothetical protein [Draconibacterium sp.]
MWQANIWKVYWPGNRVSSWGLHAYGVEGAHGVDRDESQQSLLDAGATLSFGCDFPSHGGGLKAVAPLFNIEVGHTRQVAGQPDAAIQPSKQERLAVADFVVRLHTGWRLSIAA